MSTSSEPRDDVVALYVRADGPYPRLVRRWFDADRDARTYAGPSPVVAHPPCARWGRFWYSGGDDKPGNDGGLFEHALEAIRRWGGVLEHPEASHAWRAFSLPKPVRGAWVRDLFGGWHTEIAQRLYGHKARKLTWLAYYGSNPPAPMDWRTPPPPAAYLCPPGRRNKKSSGVYSAGNTSVERLSPAENETTPDAFAHALLELAANSGGPP